MGAATASRGETLRNVQTFAVGEYPGNEPGEVWVFTDGDVKEIEDNFRLLSEGKTPKLRVPVAVGDHKAKGAYGWVTACRKKGDLLFTDWSDVHPALIQAVKEKRFLKVSAEVKPDFMDRDGKHYGQYLFRVVVLGAEVPRVPGLEDIPADSFSDPTPGRRCERTLTFAEGATMTPEEARAFLTLKKVDPAILDKMDDDAAVAIAEAWQAEETGEGEDTTQGGAGNDTLAGGAGMSVPEGGPGGTPTKVVVTRQFSHGDLDRAVSKALRRHLAPVERRTKESEQRHAALEKVQMQRIEAEKVKTVDAFLARMVDEGKVKPREYDPALGPKSLRAQLLRADATLTKQFSHGAGTLEKTEFQLQMEAIEEGRLEDKRLRREQVKAFSHGAGGTTEDPEMRDLEERTKRKN
jgi:hypothetical protein